MWNTIAWSERLLAPQEQVLFRRLSVFVGGAALSAIEAVCADSGDDIVNGVSSLVGQSLLRALPASAEAEPRVGMLETIRAYALEQLELAPDAHTTRQRHAEYFGHLASEAAARWYAPTADAWIETLHRESDNMRAALQWARSTGNALFGLQLSGALWKFWQGFGYTREGRAWLDQLLTLEEPQPNATTLVARLSGLQAAAWLASDQHDNAEATRLLEQSMLLRRALRETTGETNSLVNAARQARTEGHYPEAVANLEEALVRHRSLRERIRGGSADLGLSIYDLGLVLRLLALVRREQGHFAQAQALLDESLLMQRRFSDREGVAFALLALADLARDEGDAGRVRAYGTESLDILRDLRIQWAIGFALNTLARGALTSGDLPKAVVAIEESVRLFRDLNAYSSLAEVRITQGLILHSHSDAAGAQPAMAEALRLAWAVGPRLFVPAALEGLAVLEANHGQPERVVQLLAAAAQLRAQMGTPVRPADKPAVDAALAEAHSALGAAAFGDAWAAAERLPVEQLMAAVAAA